MVQENLGSEIYEICINEQKDKVNVFLTNHEGILFWAFKKEKNIWELDKAVPFNPCLMPLATNLSIPGAEPEGWKPRPDLENSVEAILTVVLLSKLL